MNSDRLDLRTADRETLLAIIVQQQAAITGLRGTIGELRGTIGQLQQRVASLDARLSTRGKGMPGCQRPR